MNMEPMGSRWTVSDVSGDYLLFFTWNQRKIVLLDTVVMIDLIIRCWWRCLVTTNILIQLIQKGSLKAVPAGILII